MAYYSYKSSVQTENSHLLLVGPPLVVISLFCFGLVWLHSGNTDTMYPSPASRTSADTAINTSLPLLSVYTDSQPPATLSVVEASSMSAGMTGSSQSAVTATLQPNTTASHQLQAAASASHVDPTKLNKKVVPIKNFLKRATGY